MNNQLLSELTNGVVIGAGGVLVSNLILRANRLYRLQKIIHSELKLKKEIITDLTEDFVYLKELMKSSDKAQFHEFNYYPQLEDNIREIGRLSELHLLYDEQYTKLTEVFSSIAIVYQNNPHTLFKQYKTALASKVPEKEVWATEVTIELNCDKQIHTLKAISLSIEKLLSVESSWIECLVKSIKH